MIGYVALFFTILFQGINGVIHRFVLRRKIDFILYGFLFNLYSSLYFVPSLLQGITYPNHLYPWILCFASSLFWFLAAFTGFKSHQLLEVSIRSPLMNLRIFFVLLLSFLFLKEEITIFRVISSVFIFLGLFVLTFEKKPFRRISERGVQLAIITAFFISLSALLDKIAIQCFSQNFYGFLQFILPAVYFLPLIVKRKERMLNFIREAAGFIALTSFMSAWRFYFQLTAYKYLELSLAFPLMRVSVLVTTFAGITFLGETKRIKQKIFGSILMFVGAMFVFV